MILHSLGSDSVAGGNDDSYMDTFSCDSRLITGPDSNIQSNREEFLSKANQVFFYNNSYWMPQVDSNGDFTLSQIELNDLGLIYRYRYTHRIDIKRSIYKWYYIQRSSDSEASIRSGKSSR